MDWALGFKAADVTIVPEMATDTLGTARREQTPSDVLTWQAAKAAEIRFRPFQRRGMQEKDPAGYARALNELDEAKRRHEDDKPHKRRVVLTLLGGLIAEQMGTGVRNDEGARDDLETARVVARGIVGSPHLIQKFLEEAERETNKLLALHWAAVLSVAGALEERNTLTADAVAALLGDPPPGSHS